MASSNYDVLYQKSSWFFEKQAWKKNPVSQCLARGKVLLMLRDRRDTIGPNTFQIRILANWRDFSWCYHSIQRNFGRYSDEERNFGRYSIEIWCSKVFKIKWSVAGIIMFFVNYFWYYVIVCEFEALYVLKLYVTLEM